MGHVTDDAISYCSPFFGSCFAFNTYVHAAPRVAGGMVTHFYYWHRIVIAHNNLVQSGPVLLVILYY